MSSPLQNNITNLQNLLDKVNALPEEVTLPELTNEGVADDLVSGKELIDSDGNVVTGTFSLDSELTQQDNLIIQIQEALQNKASTPTEDLDEELTTQENLIAELQEVLNTKASGGSKLETCTLTVVPLQDEIKTKYVNILGTTYDKGKIKPIYYGEKLTSSGVYSRYPIYDNSSHTFTLLKNSILITGMSSNSVLPTRLDGNTTCFNDTQMINPAIWCVVVDNDLTLYEIAPCFVRGTQISLSNHTLKNVEDINYQDDLLVWDFDNGCYASAKPIWIKKVQTTNYYYQCQFENGVIIKLVGSNGKCHRVFNVDDNIFKSATDCVGKNIMTTTGVSKLIKCERVDESVEFYNIITNYHLNLFANSVLTSCRLNNLYPIQNMKFVKDNRQVISKEDYENIDDSLYYGLRLSERHYDDISELNMYIDRLQALKV